MGSGWFWMCAAGQVYTSWCRMLLFALVQALEAAAWKEVLDNGGNVGVGPRLCRLEAQRQDNEQKRQYRHT